jgi:hypothetical protein
VKSVRDKLVAQFLDANAQFYRKNQIVWWQIVLGTSVRMIPEKSGLLE